MPAGGFLTVTKLWADDTLQFPITLSTEAIKGMKSQTNTGIDSDRYFSLFLKKNKFKCLNSELETEMELSFQMTVQNTRPSKRCCSGLTHGKVPVTDSNHSNDGLTPSIWEVNATSGASVADWVTPVPSESLNSQLVTLTQSAGGRTLVLSVSIADAKLEMQEQPAPGTDACVHATFQAGSSSSTESLPMQGPNVTIEPFDRPGMAVTNGLLAVGRPGGRDTLFNAVPGLDGAPGSVSLELATRPGCFVTTAAAAPAAGAGANAATQVVCPGNNDGGSASDEEAAFRRAASFARAAPLRRYHPLSFAARGTARNFLLEPLRSLQDEFYTVYFSLVVSDAES